MTGEADKETKWHATQIMASIPPSFGGPIQPWPHQSNSISRGRYVMVEFGLRGYGTAVTVPPTRTLLEERIEA